MEPSRKNLTLNIKASSPPENSLVKRIVYLLLILVTTFIVYAPARNAKLTNWDDDKYIVNNIDITSFKKYKSRLLKNEYQGNYHPLTMLSYAYDYSIGKLNPKVYHRTNIILHLINAALVFWMIILLTKNPESAFICGMLFGVHPLQVESVAWVSERKNVLYAMFFLLSIIAYIKYLKEYKAKFYLLALCLFICSLLSKGVAVSLTITLLAIDYLSDRKLSGKKVLIEKIPFFVLSVLFGLIAIYMQPLEDIDPLTKNPINNPFYEKILYATYNIGGYIGKLLIPLKLAMFYPYPEKSNGLLPLQYYILPFFIMVSLATSFVLLIKNKNHDSKFILFCFLFFLINIGLLLQLLPVGDAIMADRYAYIPSIGIFLLIGFGYKFIAENKSGIRNFFIAVMAGYCLWLSSLAYQRCEVWHDSFSLWTDEIEKYPEVALAYNDRGMAKHELKDLDGALADYNKCVEVDSLYEEAYSNRGIVAAVRGDQQAAMKDFDKAISINKNFAEAYKNRGRTKYGTGDYKGAVQDYSSYFKIHPPNHKVFLMRGLAYFFLNDYENAVKDYTKAIEMMPEDLEGYCNRGAARSMMEDYEGAMLDFNKAIQIDPYCAAAYDNMGKINFFKGLLREACADFQKAAEYGHAEAVEELKQYCK
jgi:Flp pilus assembly protein TadD